MSLVAAAARRCCFKGCTSGFRVVTERRTSSVEVEAGVAECDSPRALLMRVAAAKGLAVDDLFAFVPGQKPGACATHALAAVLALHGGTLRYDVDDKRTKPREALSHLDKTLTLVTAPVLQNLERLSFLGASGGQAGAGAVAGLGVDGGNHDDGALVHSASPHDLRPTARTVTPLVPGKIDAISRHDAQLSANAPPLSEDHKQLLILINEALPYLPSTCIKFYFLVVMMQHIRKAAGFRRGCRYVWTTVAGLQVLTFFAVAKKSGMGAKARALLHGPGAMGVGKGGHATVSEFNLMGIPDDRTLRKLNAPMDYHYLFPDGVSCANVAKIFKAHANVKEKTLLHMAVDVIEGTAGLTLEATMSNQFANGAVIGFAALESGANVAIPLEDWPKMSKQLKATDMANGIMTVLLLDSDGLWKNGLVLALIPVNKNLTGKTIANVYLTARPLLLAEGLYLVGFCPDGAAVNWAAYNIIYKKSYDWKANKALSLSTAALSPDMPDNTMCVFLFFDFKEHTFKQIFKAGRGYDLILHWDGIPASAQQHMDTGTTLLRLLGYAETELDFMLNGGGDFAGSTVPLDASSNQSLLEFLGGEEDVAEAVHEELCEKFGMNQVAPKDVQSTKQELPLGENHALLTRAGALGLGQLAKAAVGLYYAARGLDATGKPTDVDTSVALMRESADFFTSWHDHNLRQYGKDQGTSRVVGFLPRPLYATIGETTSNYEFYVLFARKTTGRNPTNYLPTSAVNETKHRAIRVDTKTVQVSAVLRDASSEASVQELLGSGETSFNACDTRRVTESTYSSREISADDRASAVAALPEGPRALPRGASKGTQAKPTAATRACKSDLRQRNSELRASQADLAFRAKVGIRGSSRSARVALGVAAKSPSAVRVVKADTEDKCTVPLKGAVVVLERHAAQVIESPGETRLALILRPAAGVVELVVESKPAAAPAATGWRVALVLRLPISALAGLAAEAPGNGQVGSKGILSLEFLFLDSTTGATALRASVKTNDSGVLNRLMRISSLRQVLVATSTQAAAPTHSAAASALAGLAGLGLPRTGAGPRRSELPAHACLSHISEHAALAQFGAAKRIASVGATVDTEACADFVSREPDHAALENHGLQVRSRVAVRRSPSGSAYTTGKVVSHMPMVGGSGGRVVVDVGLSTNIKATRACVFRLSLLVGGAIPVGTAVMAEGAKWGPGVVASRTVPGRTNVTVAGRVVSFADGAIFEAPQTEAAEPVREVALEVDDDGDGDGDGDGDDVLELSPEVRALIAGDSDSDSDSDDGGGGGGPGAGDASDSDDEFVSLDSDDDAFVEGSASAGNPSPAVTRGSSSAAAAVQQAQAPPESPDAEMTLRSPPEAGGESRKRAASPVPTGGVGGRASRQRAG